MKKTNKQLELADFFLIMVLTGSLISFSGCTQATDDENSINRNATPGMPVNSTKQKISYNAVPATTATTSIMVSYRLDPWLVGGTYSGELWVSPSVLGPVTQGMSTFTIEVRAQGLDAQGKPVVIIPEWTPEDPDMVAVSPCQGNQVNVTVKRAGESSLQVASRGISKTLSIKATYQDNAIRVAISQ